MSNQGLERGADPLILHFDVSEHALPTQAYEKGLSSILAIAENLGERLFSDQFSIEVFSYPDEPGGFISKTKIKASLKWAAKIASGIAVAITIYESDTAKNVVKNLTGYDLKPEHTVEEIETLFEKLIESILYTETYRLDRKLPDAINIDKSIKAKSDFYKSLIQNSKIRAIGFDRSHDFPIGRDKFPHHLSKDRIREIEPEKELVEGIIISPVTVDRDNSWTFLDKKSGKIIRAKMRDDEFKKEFLGGKHPLKESVSDDTFLVNVVYRMQERNGEPEIRETLISDVFSMNGKEIKESKTANDGGEKQSPDLPLFEHARFTDKRSRRTT